MIRALRIARATSSELLNELFFAAVEDHSVHIYTDDLEVIHHAESELLFKSFVEAQEKEPSISPSGVALVPLIASDGYVVGALVGIVEPGVVLAAEDLEILTAIVQTIEADIHARTIRKAYASQVADEQLESEFESSLAQVAAATSQSWTTLDVVQAVAQHGRTAVGASLISLALVEGNTLHFQHGEGVPESVSRSWVRVKLDTEIPMTAAARDGKVILLPDAQSISSWPVFHAAVADLQLGSFIALPVTDASGLVLAVVGLGFRHPLESEVVPAGADRLVSVTSQALQRATEYQTAKDHASVLESIVLPSKLPIAPGLELYGRYLPPLRGQRVGGDLYDAWVREDGTTAILVADVAGHTLQSARTTTRLRHSIGMLAFEMRDPSDVLRAANRYLQSTSTSHLATCCFCVIDPQANTVVIANAGHPQPRIRRADGSVTPVGPSGETLLGFGDSAYTQQTIAFESGDAIILFSDGLIERRGIDLTKGERWLESELSGTARLSAPELVALVLSDVGGRDDDLVVLAAQRLEIATQVSAAGLRESWPAAELNMSKSRELVSAWFDLEAKDSGVTELDALVLVVTELLTNAREASLDPQSLVTLECELHENRLDVRVTNQGERFSFLPIMPGNESSRGRGLAISAALSDLSVEDDSAGEITVRASFSRVGDPEI